MTNQIAQMDSRVRDVFAYIGVKNLTHVETATGWYTQISEQATSKLGEPNFKQKLFNTQHSV